MSLIEEFVGIVLEDPITYLPTIVLGGFLVIVFVVAGVTKWEPAGALLLPAFVTAAIVQVIFLLIAAVIGFVVDYWLVLVTLVIGAFLLFLFRKTVRGFLSESKISRDLKRGFEEGL